MNARAVLPGMLALVLTACGGGTKLLKNAPSPSFPEAPLVEASDAKMAAGIRYVIVRNGPGAWAKNGDWDEYLLRLHNNSGAPVTITSARLTDSLEHSVGHLDDRKALVAGSKQATKRYRSQGIRIMAGRSGGTLATVGIGAAHVGYGVGSAVAAGYGGTAAAAGALTMLAGAPVLVGVGITRAVRNSKVNKRIAERSSDLPLILEAGADADLDLFFPISPSPTRLELAYRDAEGEHTLAFDLRSSFAGLHLPAAETPAAPATSP